MKLLKNVTLIVGICTAVLSCNQRSNTGQSDESVVYKNLVKNRLRLPNGWSLTPAGYSPMNLDDLPLNMVVSPSKKYVAITNNGQSTQSIMLIDAQTEKLLDRAITPKSWVGLAFSDDERYIYASGGNDNIVLVYQIINNRLVEQEGITLGKPWPNKISPAGLCVNSAAKLLYITTKDDSSVYVCNTESKSVIAKIKLPADPYTCLLSNDKKQLYVSGWGGAKVLIVNTKTNKIESKIATAKNPNDMVLTADGRYLFVSHGNDNVVSLVDIQQTKVLETLTASLYPDAPVGSTPNGVALSSDQNTLYVANADNNCLALFDVSIKGQSRSKGFIPTGWYPTSVKLIDDKIWITNGKGFTSKPNPDGPNPVRAKASLQKGANPEAARGPGYIGGLFKGTLSVVHLPDENTLSAYSRVVYGNTPYTKNKELNADGEEGNPIPRRVGDKSPIKYVFYIIKENRTYDQVLGDMTEGNGDVSLCLFPQKVTPNQHALAREFVLLDNFYVDAEVSADGHNWSTASYANDYVEKNWVTSYGGRGGGYDYEGGGRTVAYPRDGFIWDHCQRAGVSYRSYGEFVDRKDGNIPAMKDHYCPGFMGYNNSYRDVDREAVWERDFDELLSAGNVPQFNSIRFGNDHTSGAKIGLPIPEAAVADNDLAVGRFVEHLAKSPIWNECVVFILEDDAQNGADHVDAHRSTAYMAGGMVKRGFVSHTMYSTSGMLRTIELILGLKPMSQYDAAAVPMWQCFMTTANPKPFIAKAAQVDIDKKNVAVNRNSKRSQLFDFSHPDAIDDLVFGEIVWQTVRGLGSRMPAPRRGAFVRLNTKREVGEEDDDD
jgi:DNA-binding beta-propeller fold protein YncE